MGLEGMFDAFMQDTSLMMLGLVLLFSILVLGKSADKVVDAAVELSLRWGLPLSVVGATIVSLGTTFPEVVVSVMSALKGKPGLALGNAVGSVICDTGLILGLVCLMGSIPITGKTVIKQSWFQFGAGLLLVVAILPYNHMEAMMVIGGVFERWVGWVFVGILVVFMWLNLKWGLAEPDEESPHVPESSVLKSSLVLAGGLFFLAFSSEILISAASAIAHRFDVPDAIIASTIVAFGTSLPELVTAISAVRKGKGAIALGNIVGADILNILLVAGLSAAVTPGGLIVDPTFYGTLLPVMMAMLIILRAGIASGNRELPKWCGISLLLLYGMLTFSNISASF